MARSKGGTFCVPKPAKAPPHHGPAPWREHDDRERRADGASQQLALGRQPHPDGAAGGVAAPLCAPRRAASRRPAPPPRPYWYRPPSSPARPRSARPASHWWRRARSAQGRLRRCQADCIAQRRLAPMAAASAGQHCQPGSESGSLHGGQHGCGSDGRATDAAGRILVGGLCPHPQHHHHAQTHSQRQ